MAKRFSLKGFIVLFLILVLPFAVFTVLSNNRFSFYITLFISAFSVLTYLMGWHRIHFNPDSKAQKAVLCAVCAVLIAFSFFVCAISIEDKWLFDYPFENSVDDYGCYPQMFDAFQKGQLNIDTDYDLTIYEQLENPYDTAARRELTGIMFGVTWDRAYFNGKLYSYFGIAPVVFLYYPIYFLTGKVLSDALSATLMVSIASVVLMNLVWELASRLKSKPPFLLTLFGGVGVCFGALLFPTLTNANFYHLAVLSGICAVSNFFLWILKAEKEENQIKRKLFWVFAGVSVGAIASSRPNLLIYFLIALPLLISIIIKRKKEIKSLLLDITAFCVPIIIMGILIMAYNYARFGSVFEFGASYQLTLTDISTYKFYPQLILPAFFYYFFNFPEIDGFFPYLHIAVNRFKDFGVDRLVYTAETIGSVFIPVTWGCFLVPTARKNKRALLTVIIALVSVVVLSVFDMVNGGSHLRYAADIMFVLCLVGIYLALKLVSHLKKGGIPYKLCYTLSLLFIISTVCLTFLICFENERMMILKYHQDAYEFFKECLIKP